LPGALIPRDELKDKPMLKSCLNGFATAAIIAASIVCYDSSALGADGPAIEVQVLSNFTSDVARGKVLDKLIKEFNAQHTGEYTVVSKAQPDWPTLQQQIRSLISAGKTPDVFIYNFNPGDLSREKSGQLMDWSPVLNGDASLKDRFSSSDLDTLTIDGKLIGIPADRSPALFYYNTDLLKAAGIDSAPKTWDELFADGEKLKAKGAATLAMMTADDAWHTMNAFSYIAASAGGADAFAFGKRLDSDAIVTAAEDTKKLFALSTPDALGGNYSASSSAFLNGQAAAVIDGPWLISSIQGTMKNPGAVEVAAAPTFGDGKLPAGSVITDSLNAWGAAKQSDSKKTAAVAAWMKFFTSNAAAAEMAVDGQYPMAVKTTLTDADTKRAPSQMVQVLKLYYAAPNAIVQLERNLTSKAQAQLPSLLESLALGQTSPHDFAATLQKDNTQ
jgi:raffinose/stachyose/melibiose transport system substrate-binding protein